MKFKANKTVSVKVGSDLITLQAGEVVELPDMYAFNTAFDVVEETKVEPKEDAKVEKPATTKPTKKLSKR